MTEAKTKGSTPPPDDTGQYAAIGGKDPSYASFTIRLIAIAFVVVLVILGLAAYLRPW